MTVKMLVAALCGVIAVAGVSAAFADDGDDSVGSLEPIEIRKDDSAAGAELVDDEDDDPSGDGDRTRGDDGTGHGNNHDRDATGGDDGTTGGDNSEAAAPAAVPPPAPSPEPAPVYDDYSDDGGYSDG